MRISTSISSKWFGLSNKTHHFNTRSMKTFGHKDTGTF